MALSGSLQLSHDTGLCKSQGCAIQYKIRLRRDRIPIFSTTLSSRASIQQWSSWNARLSDILCRPISPIINRNNVFKCHSFLVPGQELPGMKATSMIITRSYDALQRSPVIMKLAPAICIVVFAIWGLGPFMRHSRNILLHRNDNNWKKSGTYHITTSYVQPLLLWTGAMLICRVLDPLILPTEASQVVKQRLLNFVRSLSTVLAFAYCLSSLIQQVQKFFVETNEPSDARNMGFQFAGRAVYSAVWVAAVSLFMELLGFSTQKWLTAGGLGTVLLTLAGREIFTNFLSSAMIHATRPFVVNEWIQTKIEGYEVSGTVEHVGWWSPTIVRGEDREAVHIPNHKFTVNVVRNLSHKSHWRIKTHLAISHLDAHKINNIVADMRKVLAKNPQVEQQRLHRRVFLDNINPENQALLILISCFVKTSHHEEYLCVKEAILLDLLRVISHHRARLATPIRTVQKFYSDADLDNIPFSDSLYNRGGVTSNRPLLLIEPSYRINGDDKAKPQTRQTAKSDSKTKEAPKSDIKADAKISEAQNFDVKEPTKAETLSKASPNSVTKTSNVDESSLSSDSGAGGFVSSNAKANQKVADPKLPKNESCQPKQGADRQSGAGRPALEENIVLGVALEGSKRTLPIEDDLASHLTQPELKETAAAPRTNPIGDKDGKDAPSAIPTDI